MTCVIAVKANFEMVRNDVITGRLPLSYSCCDEIRNNEISLAWNSGNYLHCCRLRQSFNCTRHMYVYAYTFRECERECEGAMQLGSTI